MGQPLLCPKCKNNSLYWAEGTDFDDPNMFTKSTLECRNGCKATFKGFPGFDEAWEENRRKKTEERKQNINFWKLLPTGEIPKIKFIVDPSIPYIHYIPKSGMFTAIECLNNYPKWKTDCPICNYFAQHFEEGGGI